jgi:RNA polymerase sigma-70 factor (ECF subfamily)
MENGACSYRRFLEGDESGIVEIVREYRDGLMLYLNGFVRNIHTAEDLAEDTFVKLVAKRPRYDERYSFRTWLYTIGRNTALDELRRRKRRTETGLEKAEDLPSDEESVERAYLKQEERILLYRAMDRLREEYRQVLYLHYIEGLRNEETARIMRKNRRQVENLLYRAKTALRGELEKEGIFDENI